MRLPSGSRIICVTRRADVSHLGLTANEARHRRILDRVVGDCGLPIRLRPAAAMLISISRFISTAYSIGSSLTIGSMNPATIIDVAWSSVRPRDMR
jgi:hypothetical protein